MVVVQRKAQSGQRPQQHRRASDASWNCGFEGERGAPAEVVALRKRQVKNFFALLMLSNGTPMFRMGDEFLQTQGGQQQSL